MSRTPEGDALTELVVRTFAANGRLLAVADALAAAGGLTAARWQVLGAALDEPRPVADVARTMGLTRQGVQRVANLLVDEGFADWRPNPHHRRAKLLAPTDRARTAIRAIARVQHPWADAVGGAVGERELRDCAATLERLVASLDAREPPG